MALNKAKRRKEFLLILIPAILPVVDAAVVSFGLDMKLIWVPSFVLVAWPIYLLTEKFPTEEPELAFLQSVRASIYFFDLLWLIAGNGLLVTPLNLTTFVFTPLVALVSVLIDVGILHSHRAEVKLFDNEQSRLFTSMVMGAGFASVWLSVAVVQTDFVIWTSKGEVFSILIGIAFSGVLGYFAYRREAKSAKFARELADSLKRSRWHRKLRFQRRPSTR
ncbi:MAG: hypothetical protein ABSA81_01035 [Candidatus Bathyarchaeia archaeon]|jgi:hypothetical protein